MALSWEMFILLYMASLVRFSCGIIICWKETLVIFFKGTVSYCMTPSTCVQTSAEYHMVFRDFGVLLNLGEAKKDITLGKIKK